MISTNRMGLRNQVAHQGEIPSRQEALNFGAEAYKVIQEGIGDLRRKYLDHVNAELVHQVDKRAVRMGNEYPRTFMVTPTALNVIEDISTGYASFDQVVSRFQSLWTSPISPEPRS